jgi:D-alanine transaminase
MTEIIYLNGNFVPKDKAFISPEDRGFNFADGVYEVIKYYGGKPFRFADHLERLERNLLEIRIGFEQCGQFEEIFQQLVEMNGLGTGEAGVYVQITRGSHARIHRFPENILPTVYAFAFPFKIKPEQLKDGIKVITAEDIRWMRCDIKSIALLPNVMHLQKAYEQGAGETIFIRDGVVTEATHSNVMAVKNGIVYTHPDSNLILPGITKKVVMEICKEIGIAVVEEGIADTDLKQMDEVMVVGTGSEITPVVQVDNVEIGDKKPGPVTRLIQSGFFKCTHT